MKRPEGNIVVLTFEALLSCFVICVNCKDLLTNSSSRFKYRSSAELFLLLTTYRLIVLCSSHRIGVLTQHGIHNAWDTVTYHVFVKKQREPETEHSNSESQASE